MCTVETCSREQRSSQGYCGAHAERLRLCGDTLAHKPIREYRRLPERCSVATCTRRPVAKGYCAAHLSRFKKHGDPLAHIAIGDVGAVCAWAIDSELRKLFRQNGTVCAGLTHNGIMAVSTETQYRTGKYRTHEARVR